MRRAFHRRHRNHHLFDRVGIDVREERLGGSGGGLCRLRGRQVMFLDLDTDTAERLERCIEGLAMLPTIDELYLAPELREKVEAHRNQAT